jgi:hypothetical protein
LELLHQRPVEIAAQDVIGVNVTAALEVEKARKNKVVGVRIADSTRTSLAADFSDASALLYEIDGRSRRGEEGGDQVCQILVQRLNEAGAAWSTPTRPTRDEGVDYISTDGARVMLIQVTRAERGGLVWATLASQRKAEGSMSLQDALDNLKQAIGSKAEKATAAQRAELVLVLDAMDTAAYALDDVAATFRRTMGEWTRALGYQAIWVVGPTPRLTHRLDVDTP